MKINYNVSALIANNALQTSDSKLADSLERLSSGLKIANAKDNPSGLAMARRMNSQIKSLDVADDSSADGISIVETADAVIAEMQDMLQRMNELAVKSSNGTLTDDDRKIIQEEVAQLKDEVQRISDTTDFNGQKLFDGSFDLRGYATINGETNPSLSVSSYSDKVPASTIDEPATISNLTIEYDEDTNTITSVSGGESGTPTLTDSQGNVYDQVDFDGNIIKFSNDLGMSVQLEVKDSFSSVDVELELTTKGAMAVQIGANEGQYLDIRIPCMNLSNIGIYNVDVSTQEGAQEAINQIKNGLSYLSDTRSRLGAYQNRLEHTNKSIDATVENMTAAYSRIMDVDMAEEMTTYSTQQVLQQAGTSMLAQANERPSDVLQLLQ